MTHHPVHTRHVSWRRQRNILPNALTFLLMHIFLIAISFIFLAFFFIMRSVIVNVFVTGIWKTLVVLFRKKRWHVCIKYKYKPKTCWSNTLFSSSSDRKAHSSPTQPAEAIRVASCMHKHTHTETHTNQTARKGEVLCHLFSKWHDCSKPPFQKTTSSVWLPFFYCDHRQNDTPERTSVKSLLRDWI